jgi:hypothetical protein
MAGTLTTLDAVMKIDYLGPIRDQLNNDTILMNKIRKSSEEVVGKLVQIPLRFGRNTGVGTRAENAVLPTSGNQQYKETTFPTKSTYGRVEITGKTIRATRNDKGAFVRAARSELEGMATDLRDDINRQLFTGPSGVLAQISSGATSATQAVTSTQYMFEGMLIDIDTDLNNTINTIDSDTQITLNASITTATNDNIFRAGVAINTEMNGLNTIVSNTGTLQNINPATFSWWKANVIGADASPVQLSEVDMEKSVDLAEEKGSKIDYVITSFSGRREYFKLLQSQKRFADMQAVTLRGGFRAILFNDIPVVVDRHSQRTATVTRMYFLDSTKLGHYRMADFDWMQEDGAIWCRIPGSSGKENYEATLVYDSEFATTARRHLSALLGIAVS